MTLSQTLRQLLLADEAVTDVRLVGSRATGDPTPLSDWDFELDGPDLAQLAARLPRLVAPLRPLAHGWDPLGERRTYMLLLPGPTKVDLILQLPQRPAAPWRVDRETLPAIDHHFWDWTLWLAAKQLRGRRRLLREELGSLQRHILAPLGWPEQVPGDIPSALDAYRRARDATEARLGVCVSRRLEDEVAPAIESALGGQR